MGSGVFYITMSLGRGQMLMSVKQKIENELEGRVCRYPMADYTNETIVKFCNQLAEKDADAYSKGVVDHRLGSASDLGVMKTESCQFDDAITMPQSTSSSAESNADSETTNSLQSASMEEEEYSEGPFSYHPHEPDGMISISPAKKSTSRLAVQWPSLQAHSQQKTKNEYPSPSMGRGRSLQMVSKRTAALESAYSESEIPRGCDPSYSNDRIEKYLHKMIERNETEK